MAKQQAQQPKDGAGAGIGAVAVASLVDVDAADEVESLARDLFVRRATSAEAHSRTPAGLADVCFAQAEGFYAARDKRRAKKQAGQ